MEESWYVVVYDIGDDTRRARVATWLEGWGIRVQRSLFELELRASEYARMRRGLLERLDREADQLRIYHLGRRGYLLAETLAGPPARAQPRWRIVDGQPSSTANRSTGVEGLHGRPNRTKERRQ